MLVEGDVWSRGVSTKEEIWNKNIVSAWGMLEDKCTSSARTKNSCVTFNGRVGLSWDVTSSYCFTG